MKQFLILYLIFKTYETATVTTLTDITADVFSKEQGDQFLGYFAAYCDVNNDRVPDVFVISDDGSQATLLLGSAVVPYLHQVKFPVVDAPVGKIITSIVPGDFNADGQVDILVTLNNPDNSGSTEVVIYFGKNGKFDEINPYICQHEFIDQPLVLDANGDMIPDMFAVLPNNKRLFLVSDNSLQNFTMTLYNFTLADGVAPMNKVKRSNAFVDVTGDGTADLFVTSQSDEEKIIYETWKGSSDGLIPIAEVVIGNIPEFKLEKVVVGMATYGDLKGQKIQQLIVPVCQRLNDKWCSNGSIHVHDGKKWHTSFVSGDAWAFVLPDEKSKPPQHITLHIGDFDLDSFPDIVMVMYDLGSDPPRSKSVILYNRPCSAPYCKSYGRQFVIGNVAPAKGEVILTSFYDFHNDGTLDIFVAARDSTKLNMQAFENTIQNDVTFLMVQVISRYNGKDVYGSNLPGATILYTTTNIQGGPQRGACTQLSQSAHLALQLPYCIFGLGRLANFVDELMVSVPLSLLPVENSVVDFKPLNHTWTMLIPNSQMYVVPNPIEQPKRWRNVVLVTPSRNVIMTGVVLLSTLGLVALTIFVLHCIEKHEDKQEKIAEAYRFHFDAM